MDQWSSYGGLGLNNVQFKAQAMLIRSFLETAVNPTFLHSLYHNSLFRYHVLQQRDIPDPGIPPNYSSEFFLTIKNVHDNSPLNVATMTSSQWYSLLLEDNLTMSSPDENSPRQYTACRTELANPDNDWEQTWRLARLKGLGPDMTTFLWRLLHRLLPTQDRVSKIVRSQNSSSSCQLCQEDRVEDLMHAFFMCSFNGNAGNILLRCLSSIVPGLSSSQVLLLNLDLEPSTELPVV